MSFTGLIVVAVLIIVCLCVIAAYYLIKLQRRNIEIKKQLDKDNAKLREQQAHHHKSIVFLASALLQGQLSSTEASMRISWLARSFELSSSQKENIVSFDTLAQATDHIPILDEWKKLSKKQQFVFDKQRMALEKEYDDFIMASAKKIVDSNFS